MIEVYKASAGSGKTFHLAYTYLMLLLGEKRDGKYRLRKNLRGAHRNILAITFTNKATEEMKRRIIHELAVMAEMEPEWNGKSPYASLMCKELNCSEDELREAATQALKGLLYDFNFFNVSTIDAFFQTVLRTFAREAELTGNYELELDRQIAINYSVAKMLSDIRNLSVQESHDSSHMKWVVDYMRSNAADGKEFNIFNRASSLYTSLVELINNMLNEEYSAHAETMREYLKDPRRIQLFTDALRRKLVISRNLAKSTAYNFVKELDGKLCGCSNSIHSNFIKPMMAWSEKGWHETKGNLSQYISSAAEDPESVIKQSGTPPNSEQLKFIKHSASTIKEAYTTVETFTLALRHIFMLGMLGDVLKNLQKYCADNNLFLLSDTNDLLRRIISDDEVPFIYERLGMQLNHFLVDEFQDTSRMQWENLSPLLRESQAYAHDNLIIGDEKQCIYRFRSSDPSLLQHTVEDEFPDSSPRKGNINWRSSADVVRFNNELFKKIAAANPGLEKIYENVEQEISPTTQSLKGYVKLSRFDYTKAEFTEASLKVMTAEIKRQIESGYAPGEIAVLTRGKADARKVIHHLFTLGADPDADFPTLKVISDDSLEISISPSVRQVISALRYLVADDAAGERNVSKRRIAKILNHFEHILATNPGISHGIAIAQAIDSPENVMDDFDQAFKNMRNVNLVSLVENIITNYVNPKSRIIENIYLTALQDLVSDFCERGEGDITTFLKWWDDKGKTTPVSSPEDNDAIRVMTIHKSKGLEFRCVHIPFVNWDYINDNGAEWFTTRTEWFPEVNPELVPPILPLTPTSRMNKTPFAEQYREHKEKELVDELNVTYVAFTRAIEELIVQYNNTSKSIGHFITDALGGENEGCITFGEPTTAVALPDKKHTVLEPDTVSDMPGYHSQPREDVWQQMWLDTDDDDADDSEKPTMPSESRLLSLERGNRYHSILGRVRHTADLSTVIRSMVARNIISEDMAAEDEEHLSALLHQPAARKWFEDYDRVLIERSIFDDGISRPDRVVWTAEGTVDVIDYKTGDPHKGYNAQVRKYMERIARAGFSNVRGFIWYLDRNAIIPVG